MKRLLSYNNSKSIRFLMILLFLFLAVSSVFGQLTAVSNRFSNTLGFTACSTRTTKPITHPEASCGNGYLETIISPISKEEPTYTRCEELMYKGIEYQDNFQFAKSYDTLRRYIETCYLEKDAPGEFLEITSAVQGMEAVGDTIWPEYRDWLRSVLYLNPDSTYFCADLAQYAGTFVPNWPKDYKSCLTILKYLADSSYCNYFHFYMTSIWESFQRYWQDTVKDATTTPFDSTLPNIDQIGQGWLRGLQRDVTSGAYDIYQNAITVFSAVKNPFTDELELHYTAIKPTVAKIEIYDALGRMLWTDGQGYLEPREHSVRIASKDWSSGAYYARIVTLQGEVKSVKLVKE